MGRCGGMASYVMAIVLLVALFASSAKCRPEPILDDKASSNGDANAMELINSTSSTMTSSVNGSSSGSGDEKLVWCILKNCVYEGRGNAPCYCCAAVKPDPPCFETRNQCNGNCVS